MEKWGKFVLYVYLNRIENVFKKAKSKVTRINEHVKTDAGEGSERNMSVSQPRSILHLERKPLKY